MKQLRELAALHGHQSAIHALAAEPGGGCLASASRDRTIRLWAVPEGEPIITLTGHRGPVHDVCFSPDGGWLASGSGDMLVRLWDLNNPGQTLDLTGQQGAVEAVVFGGGGAQLACGWNMWSYGFITLHERASGAVLLTHQMAHGQLVFDLDYHPERGYAAALAAGFILLLCGGEVSTLRAHGEAVRCAAFSPDGSLLASGAADGLIRLWAMPDTSPAGTLKGHTRAVRCLSWSPDGARLASGGDDGAIWLWEAGGQGEMALPDAGHGSIQGLAWAAGGQLLASAGDDGVIRLWKQL
ncbi:MAG: hypothetical protein Kow00124_08490 [Anaerolineae bacterium]